LKTGDTLLEDRTTAEIRGEVLSQPATARRFGSAPLVSVTIVCYNGAQDIERCMEALHTQTWPNVEIVVIDNASKDNSAEIFRRFKEARLIVNPVNTGFSAAQNQAIRESRGDWIVCLNLDTSAEPTFLEEMMLAIQLDEHIGTVCPKILRMEPDGSSQTPPLIDSTGCYATPEMRHHNRGSQETDTGQYDKPDYVFGYTGAAALFRRAMLEDLAVQGAYLDEDFFAYREDGDFSWRAQIAGWHCLYTPYAVIHHKRHVFENNRDRVSPLINMHSTKNRFLLRINNITPQLYRKIFVSTTIRDLGVIAYVFLKERTSLPGLIFIVRHWSRLFEKRRLIQSKRRVHEQYLCFWFNTKPVALPLEPVLEERLNTLRLENGLV
jgi:GT2 family glycosyltransferase